MEPLPSKSPPREEETDTKALMRGEGCGGGLLRGRPQHGAPLWVWEGEWKAWHLSGD